MKPLKYPRLLAGLFALLLLASSSFADDLERLEGKWTTEKKAPDGETIKVSIEISKGKFKYRISDISGGLKLYAEGSVKLEKQGLFNAVRFSNIKGGQNESDLSDVNDDRVNLYVLGYETLTMAGNFDREREQAPNLDVFKKAPKTDEKKK